MKRVGLGWLDKILEWAVTINFILMIMIVLVQVVSRNVLPWSPHWTEELARFCFSYMVSLGAGLAVKDGAYVNVTILLDRVRGRLRFYMESLILTGIISLMVCMLIYSFPLLKIVSLQQSAALQINMAFMYFSMTAMSAFIALYAGAQLWVNSIKYKQTL